MPKYIPVTPEAFHAIVRDILSDKDLVAVEYFKIRVKRTYSRQEVRSQTQEEAKIPEENT